MKKLTVVITLLLVISIFALLFANPKRIDAVAGKDVFKNISNMEITPNSVLPDTFLKKDGSEVDRDFDLDYDGGILLSSENNGASCELSNLIKGSFEIEMRPYSKVSDYGINYNASNIKMNPSVDLREMKLTFKDVKGREFSVVVSGGEAWNVVAPSAKVEINGNLFGYYYERDGKTETQTNTKNSQGYYTRLHGATFGNVAYTGGKITSSDSKPLTIGFNYDTFEIYSYTYGIDAHYEKGEYRVIADLNNGSLGLNSIESFDDYTVSITFNEITEGERANVLVYSINGQSLYGDTLTNSAGPTTSFSIKSKPIVNDKFYLDEPKCFDLITNDESKFVTKVNIEDKNGLLLPIYDNSGSIISDSVYQKGCYFIPEREGYSIITYTSYDEENFAGLPNTKTVETINKRTYVTYGFNNLDRNYSANPNLKTGSSLKLYKALIKSASLLNDEYAEVSLYKDDVIYKNYDHIILYENEDVTLDEDGNYKLVYSIPHYEFETRVFNFIVSESNPSFRLSKELNECYQFGKELVLPDGYIGDKKATTVIYGPDGKAVTNNGGSIMLDQIGVYNLTFMTRLDSKTYTFKQYFNVLHSIDGLFECESGVESYFGTTKGSFQKTINGVVVTSTKNSSMMRYNNIIDLSHNTKNDSLIQLITLPSKVGELDAWQYRIRLTDIYDENKYLDITVFKGSWGNQFAYVKAGGENQILSGIEMGKVLNAYNTGCPINYSMTGESLLGTETLNLFYDYQENALYVANIKRAGYAYGNCVADFDSPDYFSEESLWSGFTTGEVYLSVSTEYLQKQSSSFLIRSINGVSFESEWIEDMEAPMIQVDTKEYNINDLPKGLVDKEYNVFNAKVYDRVDGKLGYTFKVFRDYNQPSQEEVELVDGKFIPNDARKYTIEYSAVDGANNSSTSSIVVDIVNSLDPLNLTLDNDLVGSIYVGEYLYIPKSNASGGSGNITKTIKLIDPDNEEIELTENKYLVLKTGTYKVQYSLVDYLGQTKTISFNIKSELSQNPIVTEFSPLKILISGSEYNLSNSFKALDYSSINPIEPEYRFEVIENGNKIVLDNSLYTPSFDSDKDIVIRYIASSNGHETIKEVNTKVVSIKTGNNFDLSKLFYQESISSTEAVDNGIYYGTETSNASIEYINSLIASGLQFTFTVDKENNNFGRLKIIFTDSKNENESVELTIIKGAGSSSTSQALINGESGYKISSDFYGSTAQGFNIRYNRNNYSIIDGNTSLSVGKIRKYANGDDFKGFSSEKIKVKLVFEEVEGPSRILVQLIANQSLSNDNKDRTNPLIYIDGGIRLAYEINEQVRIPKAFAADGIDPNAYVTLTIIYSGETLYDGAIDEDYLFVPVKYGKYTITYTAKDHNNRTRPISYIVNVKDRIPPVIELNGTINSAYKLNQTVELPTATVTDNNDTDLKLYIMVLTPEGELRVIDNNYTFKLSGLYTIFYYAQDSYNSYTMVEKEVYVG